MRSKTQVAKESKWIGVYVLAVFALLPSLRSQSPIDSAGALEAVDRFFETFNSRNPVLWANSLHYPHIRKPGVGKPVRPSVPSLSAEDYANRIDYSRIVSTRWDHTGVESKSIVHITSNKAHVAALYHRYNEEGDRIRTTRVTYLVTRLGDRWGIQARFGAGEPHETEADGRQADAAALEAVDRYLNAFYRADSSDWASTLRYPFVNVRVGGLDEIKTPEDAARFDRSRFDAQLGESRMTWKSLRVIQSGSDGVNVVAELSRRDPSGQLLASLSGLYLVTNLQGQWGVIGRSVIAR
jgi:hypothetical protein